MIYTCGHCHFTFERADVVEACVDCGKSSVREATDEEKEEYYKNRSLREDGEKRQP